MTALDRWGIAVRIVAAVLGSYAVATAIDVGAARALPLSRAEAVTTAALLALFAMPAVAIWAFAARTARRAWLVIAVVILAAALVGWLA